MKLELYYPTKPYYVTQGWGVKNDAYTPLGFSRHNGIDIIVDSDSIVKAMCDGTVIQTGYNDKAGNYIKYRTGLVECEGVECYVEFMVMHAKEIIAKQGAKLKAGDNIMIAGNTGFSTGPHTHTSSYRFDKNLNRLDNDPEVNNTFDFSKYFNGKYADDINSPRFLVNMKRGDRNTEVTRLQQKLKSLGIFKDECTGYYGPITQASVFEFQQKYMVLDLVDKALKGFYCGPKTRSVLNNL